MFGYDVQDEWLVQYAKFNGFVPRSKSSSPRSDAILAGVGRLMLESGVYGDAKLGTVLVKGEYRSFIALATNDPRGLMKKPSPEAWADLKTLLGTNKEPRWRRYV